MKRLSRDPMAMAAAATAGAMNAEQVDWPGRRQFLGVAGLALAGAWVPRATAAAQASLAEWLDDADFGAFVRARMEEGGVPGLSLAVIDGGRIVHTAGFGWADIAAKRAMEPGTLINIASVTKTITCAAIMQLWERGRFRLEDDVDAHLPFSVRNPAHPRVPVTFRQLLAHTSSIADGPVYESIYVCGDPQRSLESWLADYFTSGGAAYDAKQNFHSWAPGSRYEYSNIAYGVLGLLIEKLSGRAYPDYCAERIFAPLGMKQSRFLLAGMDRNQHATPYTRVTDADFSVQVRDPAWSPPAGTREAQVPHCLYSFITMPDGLARTSASELARFLLACMSGGSIEGARILEPRTLAMTFEDQGVRVADQKETGAGLTWHLYPGGVLGHTGGDPGVSTRMMFDPARGRGVVLLTNANQGGKAGAAITKAILER
jgi:CubicO group peptidase (beta-lactamase class C family)